MDMGINNLVLLKMIKVHKSCCKILSFPKFNKKSYFIAFYPNMMELYDETGAKVSQEELSKRVQFFDQD